MPRPLMDRFVVRIQQGSVLYVCAKFEADFSILSKVIRGSQNFEFGSSDPKPHPLWGHFMIQTQYGPVLYICAKFEADISPFVQKL